MDVPLGDCLPRPSPASASSMSDSAAAGGTDGGCAIRHRGCGRRRWAGEAVPRVGRPSAALPAGLVHRARDRSAARSRGHGWRCRTATPCAGRSPGSASAWIAASGRRRATTSTSTPRSRRGSRCSPGRRPTRPSTSTACAAVVTWRCSCCSTSRVGGRAGHARPAPCTSTSGRRPRRSPSPCTSSVTAWRCTHINSQGRSAVHLLPVKRFDDAPRRAA